MKIGDIVQRIPETFGETEIVKQKTESSRRRSASHSRGR